MTDLEQATLATLQQLEATVRAGTAASSKPDLLPLFDRLDDLANRLPPETDPNLRHYLQRKSYEKARLLLEGRDAENKRGTCGK